MSLTDLRKQQGLTVGRLARVLDLNVALLAAIERGEVAVESIPAALVDALARELLMARITVEAHIKQPHPIDPRSIRVELAPGAVMTPELWQSIIHPPVRTWVEMVTLQCGDDTPAVLAKWAEQEQTT